MSAPRAGDLLGHRYVLLDVLGEGSSATVFRARDRWSCCDVAVKVFCGGDPDERAEAARREHHLGRDPGHPAIVAALDVGRFGEHAFVVLELAAGEPLDVALRGAEPREIVLVVDAIAGALAALHARDLVHGDLKPANVRVARRDGALEAKLLDLGAARAPGEQGGGTVAYAAPEALGGTATIASDLFALGVVAWEAATGELPFGSPDAEGYVARLASGVAAGAERLPPALSAVLGRLLSAAPGARYRSASELRAALRTVADLGGAEAPVQIPRLVAREAQLDALREHAAALSRGGVDPLFLDGPPRTGRTRLLALAAAEARARGVATLETTARHGLVPWLHQIVDGAERLGARGSARARTAIDSTDGALDRHARSFAVLDVLASLSASAPLLVLVDDADAAPPAVRDAVRFLSAARASARTGWVIVDRPPEGGRAVRLAPLDVPGAAALIRSIAPDLDGVDELAALACERTEGAPGPIVEGTHALVLAGAIRNVGGTWRRAAEGVPAWAYGELDAARIDARIARLGAEAQHVLGALALDGGSPRTAGALLGLAPEVVADALASALRAGLARSTSDGIELGSPDVRARLVARLSPEARAAVHRRAVEGESAASDPAARAARARHLAALGRHAEAAADALEAGAGAARSGDLHAAAELLEHARAWSRGETAARAALALADVRAALGRVDDALAALDDALASGAADAVVARARGIVQARASRYDAAVATLDALRARHPLSALDRFWLGWSLMMRGRYDEADALAADRDGTLSDRARLGRLAGTIAWHRGRFDDACRTLEDAARDARDAGEPLLVAEVEQSLGTAERLRGRLDRAAAHYSTAIEAARAGGFAALLAKALNNLAIVEYQSGRWERARHAWESMQELALRLDSHEEILLAHNNLALLFQDRGELDRAERSLDRAIELARQRELARYEAMALGNRAEVRARAERWDDAETDLAESERIATRIGAEDEMTECRRRRAMIRLGRGDAAGALADAVAAAEAALAGGGAAEAGHARLLAAAAARTLGRIDHAERHLAAAEAAWNGRATRLDGARLELERARVRLAAGDRHDAVRRARRAGAVFGELGAAGALAAVREIEDADLAADRGEALLQILRTAGEASDATTLLDSVLGRIVALTGADRGVVMTFSGAEEPRVAARRGGGDAPIVSRGIADRAIASRRALVLADVDEEHDLAGRESVVRLGVRAALCAPLLSGDACLGLLYVDSTRGPELVRFGLWVVDAAAAILAPALARLAEREREHEREALLRSVAVDALETVSAVDAALDLAGDGVRDPDAAARLVAVRETCASWAARSERVLGLVRVESERGPGSGETFSVRTLVGSALSALAGSIEPTVEAGASTPALRGDLDGLSTALARMIESAAPRGGATTLRVRACDDEDGPRRRERAWRPGASAGARFVRIEVDGAPADPFGPTDAGLALRAARRLAARHGGRLFSEPGRGGGRLVMELESMEGSR